MSLSRNYPKTPRGNAHQIRRAFLWHDPSKRGGDALYDQRLAGNVNHLGYTKTEWRKCYPSAHGKRKIYTSRLNDVAKIAATPLNGTLEDAARLKALRLARASGFPVKFHSDTPNFKPAPGLTHDDVAKAYAAIEPPKPVKK